jgi:acyl-CoA thioester hydrolase
LGSLIPLGLRKMVNEIKNAIPSAIKMKKTEIQYRVPYADTDQMGVVYYANYLVYFERLRNELLREDGLPYYEIEKLGIMLPVIEAVCRYRTPAKYDDILAFSGWLDEIKGVKIKINCEVRRDGELLAEGYTVHACVDIKTRRPTRPPECLTALVARGRRS